VSQLVTLARALVSETLAKEGRTVQVVGTVAIDHRQPKLGPRDGIRLIEELPGGSLREEFTAYPEDENLTDLAVLERWLVAVVSSFRDRFPQYQVDMPHTRHPRSGARDN
jgi:hypothetical protein